MLVLPPLEYHALQLQVYILYIQNQYTFAQIIPEEIF